MRSHMEPEPSRMNSTLAEASAGTAWKAPITRADVNSVRRRPCLAIFQPPEMSAAQLTLAPGRAGILSIDGQAVDGYSDPGTGLEGAWRVDAAAGHGR